MITVAALWRYPVKSMHGEELVAASLTGKGLAGDREYAFESSGAPRGMLRLTGSERRAMLRFKAFTDDSGVRVKTPDGAVLAVDDPALLAALPTLNEVKLTRSMTPQTDCRPLALISLQTICLLSTESGQKLDPRRFRANIYLDVPKPFAEDSLVGRTVRIGESALVRITERDPRCRFVTLDPVTTEPMPELMKLLDRRHQGRAGIYAAVISGGLIRVGDDCQIVP